MRNIKVKTLGAVLAALAITQAHADEAAKPGEGSLFRGVFGDNSAENGQPAPAAAWFKGKALEWREGLGLFAIQVDWTKNAAAMIEGKEYRYLSPVFSYDKRTGEVLELHHVGLTNFPALDGMNSLPALAAARFNLASAPMVQRDASQLIEEIRMDIAAVKSRQPQGKAPAVDRLGDTALAVCQAMGVSPEDYLATLNA